MAYLLQVWKFLRHGLVIWLALGALLTGCSPWTTQVARTPVVAPVATLPPTAGVVLPPTGVTATPSRVPAATGLDARQAVLNAMNAVATAGPYHLKSTTTTGGVSKVTTGEVSLPDRFHLTTNGEELLIIGDKTYRKSGGRWVDFPVDIGKLVTGTMGTLTSEGQKGVSDVKMLGAGTVNGVPTVEYQFQRTVSVGGVSVTSTVKLWVDTLRGLPVQQQIDSQVNGQATTTLQVMTYDPSIQFPTP